jgi:calcineurin-like phosphoesterase family protein
MEQEVKTPSPICGVKIWLISDTHISHKNVLKHCPKRAEIGGFDINDVEAHDNWIIDVWNKTIGKKDIVYILGDFSFANPDIIKKQILPKLNGQKYLILGNHDKSSQHLNGYFTQITQMKEVVFKKKNFPFIEEENFRVFMSHYAMLTWPGKHHGVVNAHGHSHGHMDTFNEESSDLRVDIGFDGKLANFKPISLEQLYQHFKKKTNGLTFNEYMQKQIESKTTQI